ncbi:MAG: hypothetical protein UT86_C0003G0069 [Candidatus Magasanikbacteria bacterium GW2011_GWC2_40_17]|uniref:Uncharacterized protein n=1 Tax=Candidatus Magasanikbacteria bacterium GW2011_GWA2_42_32 TaxID=1619039 RepID=A0A0G1A7E8_9BACT|nr:MAG: hypothetical protein UT86_C0003G0069 [Candidatus Magasanikbacteria bacterium GW2011_GWC2_40_17]KKS56972.1 MAG: hypothetical protein UV20_C0004G0068 [Candidatus Magasanikbacteria bacterium GW2011_GWA2_42_32]
MKNYSRKKSTAGKVAFRSPSRSQANRSIEVRDVKAGCCKSGLKGRCSC